MFLMARNLSIAEKLRKGRAAVKGKVARQELCKSKQAGLWPECVSSTDRR